MEGGGGWVVISKQELLILHKEPHTQGHTKGWAKGVDPTGWTKGVGPKSARKGCTQGVRPEWGTWARARGHARARHPGVHKGAPKGHTLWGNLVVQMGAT